MKKTISRAAAAAAVVLAAGCASHPKAPTVDEWRKQPANSKDAVELQGCRGQLKNTQLLLEETSRLAKAASTALSSVGGRCNSTTPPAALPSALPLQSNGTDEVAAVPASYKDVAVVANTVFVLFFGYGSSAVDLTAESAMELSDAAKDAKLIVIRGRTDGHVPDAGNEGVARRRADAVKKYLVALGVPAERIRATYQAVGDHAARNDEEAGRSLNRRAEVEVYSARPQVEILASNTNAGE